MKRLPRYYSTGAGNEKAVFLSDILQRIEKIGLSRPEPRAKPAKSKPANKTPTTTQQPQAPNFDRLRNQKIAVADHPMYSNKFKTQYKDSRAEKSRDSRPSRAAKPRTARANSKKPASKGAARTPQVSTIISKTVVAKDLTPRVTGDDFLHGKAASFQFNLTSRLTSVLKSQLLESKYPYKLPKHVIESAPAETNSKFLLSSTFNSNIDQTTLKTQLQKVALGKYHMDQLPGESAVVNALNRNGHLSIAQKQAMFSIIQNPQSAKF